MPFGKPVVAAYVALWVSWIYGPFKVYEVSTY
jgi:hypothetical protein